MSWIDFIQNNLTYYYIIVIFFGLIIGSFLNVVIVRLPTMIYQEWFFDCIGFLKENTNKNWLSFLQEQEKINNDKQTVNLVFPRSYCPQCGTQISALENIPVLSYLSLKENVKIVNKIYQYAIRLLNC